MNEIAKLRSLFDNLYTPTQRLLSKRREGSKYIKRFENPPKTPARRVLEDTSVSLTHKQSVRCLLAENDPLELRHLVERKTKQFAKLEYEVETQRVEKQKKGNILP